LFGVSLSGPLVSDNAEMVARILCDRNIGSMPVIANQESRKLVGMITDRDLCCSVIAQGLDPKTTTIEKLISLAPFTCRDGENIETCERLMQEHQVRRVPIVDAEDRIIGIVSQADLALYDKADRVSKTVAQMSKASQPSIAA
jgi:CBS-domain-containing membrane protein